MCIRCSIKYLLAASLLAVVGVLWAAPRTTKPHNHVWLSLAGGEANNRSKATDVKPQLGAGANLGVGYELQYGGLLFGVGVEADYQWLRDALNSYIPTYSRLDREGEHVQYGYCHESYLQTEQAVRVAIPVYLGGRFGEYVYALVGASVDLPLMNRYSVQTQLLTQGTYAWSIDPIRTQGGNNFTSYGYYANDDYHYQSSYKDYLSAHARAEIGSYIPLEHSRKTQLRLGLYCSYGFRLGSTSDLPLLDLSKVDLQPQTQNQTNLREHIAWRALSASNCYSQLPQNMEVGVKLTVLFNVDVTSSPCHCVR